MNYNDTRDSLLQLVDIDTQLRELPSPQDEISLIPGRDHQGVDLDAYRECRDAARRNLRIMANNLMDNVYIMSDPLYSDLDTLRRSINN